jgi:hypothetical protein
LLQVSASNLHLVSSIHPVSSKLQPFNKCAIFTRVMTLGRPTISSIFIDESIEGGQGGERQAS